MEILTLLVDVVMRVCAVVIQIAKAVTSVADLASKFHPKLKRRKKMDREE